VQPWPVTQEQNLVSVSHVYNMLTMSIGECWNFILQQNPDLKTGCGSPYPIIAEKASGKYARLAVLFSVYVTLFGACVVLLLVWIGSHYEFIIYDLQFDP